jgi:hypothetical protein
LVTRQWDGIDARNDYATAAAAWTGDGRTCIEDAGDGMSVRGQAARVTGKDQRGGLGLMWMTSS